MRITGVTRASALLARGAVLAACGAVLASSVMLTACGSGGSHTSGAATAGQSGDNTVALARCYRTHGDPGFPDPTYDPSDGKWHFDWPDPDPDGGFGLPPALQVKTPAYARAAQACQRLMPSGGLNEYAAS